MSEEIEIIVSRADKPDDEEIFKINKNDTVLKLLKLAKQELYPEVNISVSDLIAHQKVKDEKCPLKKKTQKINDLQEVEDEIEIEFSYKPTKTHVKETDNEKEDAVTIWAAKETSPDATIPVKIDPGKTVYDLIIMVKEKLFSGKTLDELHAIKFSSKEIIKRQETIKNVFETGGSVLFRIDRNANEVEVEKLKFNQETEMNKLIEAKVKIEGARTKASCKTIQEKEAIYKTIYEGFGIKDFIQKEVDAEKLLNEMENDLSKEESELRNNSIDVSSFSIKDRCQELMTHISGNCVSYEIEQPILSNVTNEKIYKMSSNELHRKTGNQMFSSSQDENFQVGVDAAVPISAFCNLSALFSHGREKSSFSVGGKNNDSIQTSNKATVTRRHYQQILKFNIAKASLSVECEQDLAKLGQELVNNDPETRKKDEEKLLEFLQKYPERVYTGPFGAGGWFEFNTSVETSKEEDINKLRAEAIESNKKSSEIASNITLAGLGEGSIRYGSLQSGQHDVSTESLSNNTSSKYTKTTTFECMGPPNTRTPATLTSRLTSPNNWAVFPSCDEKNPSAFLTPIYQIIGNTAEEKNDEILRRAALKLERILKSGPKMIIREPNIPPSPDDSHRLKNVMFFGKTGQGKSLLGNVVLGEYKAFKVGEGTASCTKKSKDETSDKRRICIHDTCGLSDTSDQELGMSYLAGSEKAIIAVLDTWQSLGADGLDAVIFVQKRSSKVTAEDAALAKYAKHQLFGADIGKRALLVLTDSTPKQVIDTSARIEFLEKESNADGNFADLYNLVEKDPSKVIFVNNKNPDPSVCVDEDAVIKAKQENVDMAEIVLSAIHSITLPPLKTPIHHLEARRIELELQMMEILETHRNKGTWGTILDMILTKKKSILINKIREYGLDPKTFPPETTLLIKELKRIEERKKKLAKNNSGSFCNIL